MIFLAAANVAGDVGVDQLRALANVHANERARPHMPEAQDTFVDAARGVTAREFDEQLWALVGGRGS